MNKHQLLLAAALMLAATAGAQTKAGGISQAMLSEIRSSQMMTAADRAIANAIAANPIDALAQNRANAGAVDTHFSIETPKQSITDQQQSGRCWMFSGMNVLRSAFAQRTDSLRVDFSQAYLFFYDQLEKANLFLENVIRTAKRDIGDREVMTLFGSPVNDGGVWNLYFNLAAKYGVVPAEVMPETAHSDNTAQMIGLVNESLRRTGMQMRHSAEAGAKVDALRQRKMEGLEDVYRILALCLGEPPAKFTWRYKDADGNIRELKDCTPLQFHAEITPEGYTPDNYIMIMNDPTRPYYKVYEIQNYRNSYEGVNWVYLNLPNDAIKKAALASIKNNEAMYASCDVGKQFDSKKGISDPGLYDYSSLLGVDLDMDKADRIWSRQSGSSHAMTLVGCDVDQDGNPVKWEFENSWGPSAGNNGYITFTDEWFDEYMFRLVIRKAYLEQEAVDALDSKPVQLPMWDFMF